ncbi:hypothetical protein N9U42_03715, partial [Luminiphilus sp.]
AGIADFCSGPGQPLGKNLRDRLTALEAPLNDKLYGYFLFYACERFQKLSAAHTGPSSLSISRKTRQTAQKHQACCEQSYSGKAVEESIHD